MSKTLRSPNANFNARIAVFKIFLGIFAALIVLRLFVISVSQHSTYSAMAESQHSFYQKLTANRGEILISDRYSEKPYPVATTSHKDLVYVVPQSIQDANAVADTLSKILEVEKEE